MNIESRFVKSLGKRGKSRNERGDNNKGNNYHVHWHGSSRKRQENGCVEKHVVELTSFVMLATFWNTGCYHLFESISKSGLKH
jgi:hypothetical protein